MKNFLLRIFSIILLSYPAFAQKKSLNGRVLDEKTSQPLPFVSVYIANSTNGTLTNEQGGFSLSLPAGHHEIVVSMVGYGPIIHPVEIRNDGSVLAPVLFKMAPQVYALDTVSIIGKRDASWYSNLRLFQDYFLGKSAMARNCRLLNPEALMMKFDVEKQMLTMTAKEPLKIENPELGYKISFLLVAFVWNKTEKYSSYLGYPHFEEMEGTVAQKKDWHEKRLEAFQGSTLNFVRALRDQKLESEGFRVNRLEEGITATATSVTADGKPIFTVSKKYLEVPYSEYLSFPDNVATLQFKGQLQVVYLRKMEDLDYVYSKPSNDLRKASYQTSYISLNDASVALMENGSFDKPLAIRFEGYWSWDKVGDMLPFDYTPPVQ